MVEAVVNERITPTILRLNVMRFGYLRDGYTDPVTGKHYDEMPTTRAVRKAIADAGRVSELWNARVAGMEYAVDMALTEASNAEPDVYLDPETGEYKIRGNSVQRSKLIVDTIKWASAKVNPARYSERIKTEHSGSITIAQILDQIEGGSLARHIEENRKREEAEKELAE